MEADMSLRKSFFSFAFLCLLMTSNGQSGQPDTPPAEIHSGDTNQVNLLVKEADKYYFNRPDTALFIAKQAIQLAHELEFKRGELAALNLAGEALRFLGDFPQALEMQSEALKINRKANDKYGEAKSLGFIGFIYSELGEHRQALNVLLEAKKIDDQLEKQVIATFRLSNIGNAYEGLNLLDSALFYQKEAQSQSLLFSHPNLKILTQTRLGKVYGRMGQNEQALEIYRSALRSCNRVGDKVNPGRIEILMAQTFGSMGQKDSSLHHARLAYLLASQRLQKVQVLGASNLLIDLYRERKLPDSLIRYLDISARTNDELFGPEKLRRVQLFELEEQKRQQDILVQQENFATRVKMYALAAGLAFVLVIVVILYQNIRQKQKVNALLLDQKEEIQNTLTKLKSTQAQLIASEKMASLGELTVGIAHEIQNPLNFVNNFAEVNTELIDEMRMELKAGRTIEASLISDTVIENERKIVHHGKRADAIVKGMLQHSRSSTGVKEATDINALANEYLSLAFHGMRAKDKSFNACLKTDFDATIQTINIVPQDIGRVILNLITNAFYAVSEKSKQHPEGFEPIITIGTKNIGPMVELKVSDNGNGISQDVLSKIFQPFFTTKPAGQGTGLGLSLSYDIVAAHGGEIRTESTVGEGSAFIIHLPI